MEKIPMKNSAINIIASKKAAQEKGVKSKQVVSKPLSVWQINMRDLLGEKTSNEVKKKSLTQKKLYTNSTLEPLGSLPTASKGSKILKMSKGASISKMPIGF